MRRLFFLLVLFVAAPCDGRYARPDLEKVPLAQLIGNLNRQAEQTPKDPAVWHNIGRAHAMAYSFKLGHASVVETKKPRSAKNSTGKPSKELWFGYQPKFIPFAEKKDAADEAATTLAAQHLKNAIAAYEKSLSIKADDPIVSLGLGWCSQQSGKTAAAIKAYRKALAEFWKRDKDRNFVLGPVATAETIEYLMPLLDQEKDAGEIADMNKKLAHIKSMPRAMTPIAISLDPKTTLTEILDPDATVSFDVDASGSKSHWCWITPKAGWLVYDQQKTESIDSAIQLFGNRTFMLFLDNGYQAMRLLDANGDDRLADGELDGLAIWIDEDSNGVSDPGEVKTLAEFNIVGLDVHAQRHPGGILYNPAGVTFASGQTTSTFDVILHRK